jgi:hypothetical protein
VYKLLKEYRNRRVLSILFAKLLLGEKVKLIVDGTMIKLFNRVSRWRKGINLLAYLYGYAIGYSFFRKSQIWG